MRTSDASSRDERIAVVGASNKPERPGNDVFALPARPRLRRGRRSIPGIAGQTLHGRPVVAIARRGRRRSTWWTCSARSDQVGPVVDDAIRLGASTVWMQLGVINEAAAEAGRGRPGCTVVMDRCPAIEWPRLAPAAA